MAISAAKRLNEVNSILSSRFGRVAAGPLPSDMMDLLSAMDRAESASVNRARFWRRRSAEQKLD